MEETTDGFRIAEADLEIRGPGDFLGTRQAGLPDFRVANILRDGRVLEEARKEAFAAGGEGPDAVAAGACAAKGGAGAAVGGEAGAGGDRVR